MSFNKVGTTYTGLTPDDTTKLDNAIILPIREASESRSGKFVMGETLKKFDINFQWDKVTERAGFGYGLEITDVPSVDYGIKRFSGIAPVLYSSLRFTYDEWDALRSNRFGGNARITEFGKAWAKIEDIKTYIGDSNVGINPLSDTTNETTSYDGTANVSSISNIHSTIAGICDAIDDQQEFKASSDPITVEVTYDVWKTMRSVLDTTIEFKNGLAYAQQILKEFAPKARLSYSRYLGGSVTKGADGRHSLTSGTQALAFWVNKPEVISIRSSPLEKLSDPLTVRQGMFIRWAERWVRHIKNRANVWYKSGVTLS